MSSRSKRLMKRTAAVANEFEDTEVRFMTNDTPSRSASGAATLGTASRLTAADFAAAAVIAIAALILNGYGLGSLEFFRHTEADRTLIAWEMLESGDYLLPHLLHSEILTKPPLYYWTLALSMKIFGSHAEWVTRVPSVLASAVLGTLQLLVFRRIGFSLAKSLLVATVTLTGFAYFVMATLAEIDFLYGLFTAASLYACFFSLVRPRPANVALAYFLAGAAFLIKGPPVVFFFIASVGGYLFLEITARFWGRPKVLLESARERDLVRTVLLHLGGVLVFLAVVSLWIVPLANRVGWSALGHSFKEEVFDRVVSTSRLVRGPHYYLFSLAAGLMPWTIGMLFGLYERWQSRKNRDDVRGSAVSADAETPFEARFLTFNLVVVVTALMMLSIASGKSSRYIFPVFPFASNLAVYGLEGLRGGRGTKGLCVLARWTGALLIAAVIGSTIAFFVGLIRFDREAVLSTFAVLISSLLGIAAGVALYKSGLARSLRSLAITAVCLMVMLRVWQVHLFNPLRNAQRSMKPIAAQINQLLPEGAVVYHVELFDRWASYYLKGMGRETYRLTPKELEAPRAVNGRSFVLLNGEEEEWRLTQIKPFDPTLRVLMNDEQAKDRLILIDVDSGALEHFNPSAWFPTSPTPPFYGKPPARAEVPES